MINIMKHGAVGDGRTLNTEAFAKAILAAKQTGETVLVPATGGATASPSL